MHPSKAELNDLTDDDVQEFYNLMVRFFPLRTNSFANLMQAGLEGDLSPSERFKNLMWAVFDWTESGN